MTKSLLVVLFSLLLSVKAFAQVDLEEDRVKEIRAMYGRSQAYLKTAKSCREREKVVRRAKYEGGEVYEYPQRVKRCDLSSGLSVINGTFREWELEETISFFQEGGDVYFVFVVIKDVRGTTELRIYYDLKGRLIRLLEKSDHITGRMGENVKITDQSKIQSVYDYISKRLDESKAILSQN